MLHYDSQVVTGHSRDPTICRYYFSKLLRYYTHLLHDPYEKQLPTDAHQNTWSIVNTQELNRTESLFTSFRGIFITLSSVINALPARSSVFTGWFEISYLDWMAESNKLTSLVHTKRIWKFSTVLPKILKTLWNRYRISTYCEINTQNLQRMHLEI